jgi:hypothetical protein
VGVFERHRHAVQRSELVAASDRVVGLRGLLSGTFEVE